jgi:hypothetical protein
MASACAIGTIIGTGTITVGLQPTLGIAIGTIYCAADKAIGIANVTTVTIIATVTVTTITVHVTLIVSTTVQRSHV